MEGIGTRLAKQRRRTEKRTRARGESEVKVEKKKGKKGVSPESQHKAIRNV